MIRSASCCVVLATCLLVIACSGQGNEPTGGAGQGPDAGEGGPASPDVSEPGIDSDIARTAPIAIDVVAALFPVTPEDATNITALYSLFGRLFDLSFVACMADAGFEIELPGGEPSNRYFDFPDLEVISRQGFGVTADDNGQSDPLENVPLELRAQFMRDQDACYSEYVEAHGDPLAEIFDGAGTLQDEWYGELAAIDVSPEIVSQFQIWRQCMSDGGWVVEDHRDFFGQLNYVLFGLLDENSPSARSEELAAAELYVSCMIPLEEVRLPMRDEARARLLEDNAEEIRAIAELADRLIQEAQQQQQQ